MNQEQLRQFGQRYRRYLRWMTPIGRYSPAWLWPLLQKTLGRYLSPYRLKEQAIRASLTEAVGTEQSTKAWEAWLDSHTHFVRDLSRYHLLEARTLQQWIHVANMDVVEQLRAEGGLLLSYHSYHPNTMACVLDVMGCKVHAVTGRAEKTPLFPYIGPWINRLNEETVKHLQGGEYLIIDNMWQLMRSTKSALENKGVVICLADLHKPDSKVGAFPLFSRQISPPSGVLDLALRQQAPIYLAMCAPEEGQLVLRLSRLGIADNRAAVLAAYVAFLEQACRQNPACWQGWDWFSDLPERTDRANVISASSVGCD